MSTNSLTKVFDDSKRKKLLVAMYVHYDGYPSGHGKDLVEFLTGFKIVDGLSGDSGKIANGFGCLAAQIVANFKDGPGDVYLMRSDNGPEEYNYDVYPGRNKSINIRMTEEDGKVIYDGPLKKAIDYCKD